MNSTNESSHKTEVIDKPRRAQLQYLQLDSDFASKPKIVALRARFGHLGVHLLVLILLDLARGTDAEIDRDCAIAQADLLGLSREDGEAFIEYCIEREILGIGSKDYLITNSRVKKDQESLAKKQDDWRRRQRESRGGHADVTRDTGVTLNVNKCLSLSIHKDLKEGGVGGDSSPQERRVAPAPPPAPLQANAEAEIEGVLDQLGLTPLGLETKRVRGALRLWARHVISNLKRSFDAISAQALVAAYGGRPDDLARDLAYSTAGRYRRVYPAPMQNPRPEDVKRATVARKDSAVLRRHKPVEEIFK